MAPPERKPGWWGCGPRSMHSPCSACMLVGLCPDRPARLHTRPGPLSPHPARPITPSRSLAHRLATQALPAHMAPSWEADSACTPTEMCDWPEIMATWPCPHPRHVWRLPVGAWQRVPPACAPGAVSCWSSPRPPRALPTCPVRVVHGGRGWSPPAPGPGGTWRPQDLKCLESDVAPIWGFPSPTGHPDTPKVSPE